LLHLDRSLAGFFRYLDKRLGLDNVLIALTAITASQRSRVQPVSRPSGLRIDSRKLMADLNEQLAARFGPGTYATHLSYPTIHLDTKLIDANSLDGPKSNRQRRAFSREPAIAAVYTARSWRMERSPADAWRRWLSARCTGS